MTREEALTEWVIPAIRKTWNEKKCDEVLKALNQEPKYCDRNICIRNEHNGIGCGECEVTKSQEPCEDAISRKQVKEQMRKYGFHAPDMTVTEFIEGLPSVQPKTGHWIRMKAYEKWGCSECDTVFRFTFKEHGYCPNCGAKMTESEEVTE